MKVNASVAVRAGLVGALIGLAVAVVARIPILGCLVCGAGPLVGLVTGALYVHFAGGTVDLAEGAIGAGIAGAIAGAANGLASALSRSSGAPPARVRASWEVNWGQLSERQAALC